MPDVAHPGSTVLAAAAPSAGGAPLDQIAVMVAFTTLVYGALAWVVLRERLGHPTLVGRAAATVGRLDGSPAWFALPLGVVVVGVVSAVVGLYWDVSYHISAGRDEGPLANPAHYFIFLGLVAIFAGAVLAVGLADRPAERGALPERTCTLLRDWRTPYGPLVGTVVAMIALLGFPLDDLWHRLFGQDVTEWGPTHVVMIGGTVLSGYAILLTCAEVRQVSRSRVRPWLEHLGLLVIPAGPVAFLLEYAFGVPQFPLLNDPLVLATTAALTFVLASLRAWWLPVALWAAYAGLQAGLLGLNTAALDALAPWPPLLLGGALVATVLTHRARPTWAYGLLAGAAVGLAQTATEAVWTGAVRPLAWPPDLLPLALAGSAVVGAAAGLVAVWLHTTLVRVGARSDEPTYADAAGRATRAAHPLTGRGAALGLALVVAVLAVTVPPRTGGLAPGGGAPLEATLRVVDAATTTDVGGRDGLAGRLEVTLSDPAVGDRAWWFETLSWQGGGVVHGELERVDADTWRTTGPVPLHGSWKTLVRVHDGPLALVAAPAYLPEDAAIPAPEVPAPTGAAVTRPFVEEATILRREARPDVPTWLSAASYAVVGVLFGSLFWVLGAGYAAAARRGPRAAAPARTRPSVGAGA